MSEKIIQKFKNKNSEKPRKLDLCARNFYKKICYGLKISGNPTIPNLSK